MKSKVNNFKFQCSHCGHNDFYVIAEETNLYKSKPLSQVMKDSYYVQEDIKHPIIDPDAGEVQGYEEFFTDYDNEGSPLSSDYLISSTIKSLALHCSKCRMSLVTVNSFSNLASVIESLGLIQKVVEDK